MDRHRDLFPIPLIAQRESPNIHSSTSQRRRRARFNRNVRPANLILGSLNEMFSQAGPHACDEHPPSLAQFHSQGQVLQQVECIANKIPMYSEREATRSLLQSCLSYSEGANTTVRSFQPDLVSLPRGPPRLQDVVDDFGRDILKDPVGNMMLGPDEWGHKVEKG